MIITVQLTKEDIKKALREYVNSRISKFQKTEYLNRGDVQVEIEIDSKMDSARLKRVIRAEEKREEEEDEDE